MQALCLYAGPLAMRQIARDGLLAQHVRTMAGAAGGPKGLVLGPLDRFLFGDWLARSEQPLDLVGASIGAWRMATACLNDPASAFKRLEQDYIRQHYEPPPGKTRPSPDSVSEAFGASLRAFYGPRAQEVLQHPRYRLHMIAARGRHLLRREHALATPLGYLGAFVSNLVLRRAMGAWLERVVFSSRTQVLGTGDTGLPFRSNDYRTRALALTMDNFHPALQASCAIPFMLRAVNNIPGAPAGAYWDGGITDYHLHLDYAGASQGLVLYPHFQRAVVPGWLDKRLHWRHKPTRFLATTLLLAPNPEWVRTLPNAKLPDRQDFMHYGRDLAGRVKAWSTCASASEQLADEFAQWLRRPDPARLRPL